MHSPQKIAVKLMILGTDQGYSNIQTGSRIKSTVKTVVLMLLLRLWTRCGIKNAGLGTAY